MVYQTEIDRYKKCLLRHERQIGGGNVAWGNVVFRGRRGQRGYGFGFKRSFLGRLVLPVVNFFKEKIFNNKDRILCAALDTGKDIFLEHKDPKMVLKRRGKQLLMETLVNSLGANQKGSGSLKRTTTAAKKRGLQSILFDEEENYASVKK